MIEKGKKAGVHVCYGVARDLTLSAGLEMIHGGRVQVQGRDDLSEIDNLQSAGKEDGQQSVSGSGVQQSSLGVDAFAMRALQTRIQVRKQMGKTIVCNQHDANEFYESLRNLMGILMLHMGISRNLAISISLDVIHTLKKEGLHKGLVKRAVRLYQEEISNGRVRLMYPTDKRVDYFSTFRDNHEIRNKAFKKDLTLKEYYDFWSSQGLQAYSTLMSDILCMKNRLVKYAVAHGEKNTDLFSQVLLGMMFLVNAQSMLEAIKGQGMCRYYLERNVVTVLGKPFDMQVLLDRYCMIMRAVGIHESVYGEILNSDRNVQIGLRDIMKKMGDESWAGNILCKTMEDYGEDLLENPELLGDIIDDTREYHDLAGLMEKLVRREAGRPLSQVSEKEMMTMFDNVLERYPTLRQRMDKFNRNALEKQLKYGKEEEHQ